MTAVNGEWVNDLAKEFNASQKAYKVVPTFKGTDAPRSAGIVAKSSASVLKISQSSIQQVFIKNEKALEGIVELIAKREAGLKAFTATQTRDLEESLLAQMGATLRRFWGYGADDV